MEEIRLKKYITHRNKTVFILIFAGAFMAIYSFCGAITANYATYIPLLKWEESLPLLPSTILIYIVFYPLFLIWSLYSYKDEETLNKLLYGFTLVSLITFAIFLIFPVIYPREYYPLSLSNDPINLIFRAVRTVDKPSNCLPSLHVAICYLFAFNFYQENKKKFWSSMAASTIISISTLTTKQHYFFDVLSGFMISFLIWWLLYRFTRVSQT